MGKHRSTWNLDLITLGSMYLMFSLNTPLFEQLTADSLELFASNMEVLGFVTIGIFGRIGSIIVHFACGYLCFMSAYHRKPLLFLLALPAMSIVDALIPFVGDTLSSVILFELGAFALSVIFLLVAWHVTKDLRKQPQTEEKTETTTQTKDTYSTITTIC
ncbi:MAG: hypothetical protein FWD52_08260 [Candidatus Bathyarchaeota archaeon]|nr:hypothetical protein [Candidatus Termiticorpusculum sp.]